MQDGVARMDIHGDDRCAQSAHGEAAFHGHVGLVGRENEAHGSAGEQQGDGLTDDLAEPAEGGQRAHDEAGNGPHGVVADQQNDQEGKEQGDDDGHDHTQHVKDLLDLLGSSDFRILTHSPPPP